MKITFITIGSPHGDYKNIFNEYAKRSSRFANVQVEHVKDNKDVEKKVLTKIGKSFCILLDEHGEELTSRELTSFLKKKEINGTSDISFVIGGADGHTSNVRNRGDFIWSLSKLTFPHDMAMVFLVEAVYRALTISAGHPYHRE